MTEQKSPPFSQPLRVAVATLGCKVNQFESAAFMSEFESVLFSHEIAWISGFCEQGCKIVPAAAPADIVVINTCVVTARAEQESRQLIRRLARHNPAARLVITGCYAQTAAAELSGLVPNRPIVVIGNGSKHHLVRNALAEKPQSSVTADISAVKHISPLRAGRVSGRTRAFLRVQDGCNNFCSYCIVPYARGRSRSLPIAAVLEQAQIFTQEGCREIIVTGINVGKYGMDLDKGQDIYLLLETLCRQFPTTRIRLSSIEPTEVSDRLLRVLTEQENFMPHFHIPLQSGDNGILARMNRRYTAETFAEAVRCIYAAAPHAAIGCDMLAGFPGEDDQAAENTFRLLAELPVSYLHVFPYSLRPGTAAAELPDHVPAAVKEQRVACLRALDREKRATFQQRHLGTEQRVLVERKKKNAKLLKGFTENYIPVRFSGPASLAGGVAQVRLISIGDDGEAQGRLSEL
jgi:threonylcarbamoyladenosine tRNA methylthiotransferase MtaB